MQKKLQEQREMLDKMHAPPISKETATTSPRQHAQPRVRPMIIPIEENSERCDSEDEQYHRRSHRRGHHHYGPQTPLSEELEEVQWPHRLNPAVLPQFDGKSDPKEFLLKYEATIQAAGGGSTCKAKALVLALRGLSQRWYTNILFGTILSWSQLRSELNASFRAVRPDEVTSCNFHNLKQGSLTLQEYLECIIKLRTRGPDVAKQSIIDAAVRGRNLGPCGEYLERHKPRTMNKLFEIKQEYCKSDRGKRRRIEEMNEQKKARNSDRSHSKPWHADQSKHQKAVNTVS